MSLGISSWPWYAQAVIVVAGLMILVVAYNIIQAYLFSVDLAIRAAQQLVRQRRHPDAVRRLQTLYQRLLIQPDVPRKVADLERLREAIHLLKQRPDGFADIALDGSPAGTTSLHPESASAARTRALEFVERGDHARACQVYEKAVATAPPDLEKVILLILWSNSIRLMGGPAEREFAVLDAIRPLQHLIPPPPPGRDIDVNRRYIYHMNRAVSASRLRRYDVSVPAYRDALREARDPDTRGKCRAYLCGDWIKVATDGEWAEIARELALFDEEFAGTNASVQLLARIKECRAMCALHEGDKGRARSYLCEAIGLASHRRYHAVLECLGRPGVTAAEVLAFARDAMAGKVTDQPPGSINVPLPPLSEGI